MKASLLFLVVVVVVLGVSYSAALPEQIRIYPGSVVRGERILEENCLGCHALDGRGGNRAPDFSTLRTVTSTPSELAASLWNHSPRMWTEFALAGKNIPQLNSFQSADLFSWFYAATYFSRKGDASRGMDVFQNRNCVNCHSEILDTRSSNGMLQRWAGFGPLNWAERMWNHAGEMNSAAANRGLAWPILLDQDVADLMKLVESLAPAGGRADLQTGEPERGRAVFERSCESCHSFGEPGSESRVNLLSRPGPSFITGYIAAMWNHAPEMQRRGQGIPRLNPGEMSDLIAFLFAQRYFFDRGDPALGRSVFQAMGCVTCHETRRREFGAPELWQSAEEYSPVTLTSAVWRHGPSMLQTMREQRMSWPQFRKDEMADLIAYLNSRLIVRIGVPR
jgi:mono/diheme cytochrome c family protein